MCVIVWLNSVRVCVVGRMFYNYGLWHLIRLNTLCSFPVPIYPISPPPSLSALSLPLPLSLPPSSSLPLPLVLGMYGVGALSLHKPHPLPNNPPKHPRSPSLRGNHHSRNSLHFLQLRRRSPAGIGTEHGRELHGMGTQTGNRPSDVPHI